MNKLHVKVTNHALKRLSKRLGIKGLSSAIRYAEEIVLCGKVMPSVSDSIIMNHHGHSFVFMMTADCFTSEKIMLMITACNDDKSSEWKCHYHGEIRKKSRVKQSKIHRNSPIVKPKDKPKNHCWYDEDLCA